MESPVKNNVAELVTVRPHKEEDRAFIVATWCRGYYYGEKAIGEIDKSAFMENYNKRINNLIDSGSLNIQVVVLKEDPEVILAYSVSNKDSTVLHWIFTKTAWRKTGLAKSVIPASINTVSHLTSVGRSLLKKYENVKYNPFKL